MRRRSRIQGGGGEGLPAPVTLFPRREGPGPARGGEMVAAHPCDPEPRDDWAGREGSKASLYKSVVSPRPPEE